MFIPISIINFNAHFNIVIFKSYKFDMHHVGERDNCKF